MQVNGGNVVSTDPKKDTSCGGRDHCFMCDIIKSRNTQISRFFST